MARDKDWKLAQDKVGDCFRKYMDSRKDFYFRRFTDTYEAGGNVVQKQPSDTWFIYQGMYSLCEIKSSHYADKFYFKDVQNSQWIGALRVLAAGGYSMFLIVKLPEWQWHLVSGRRMLELRELGENGMPWSDMTKIRLHAETILKDHLPLCN